MDRDHEAEIYNNLVKLFSQIYNKKKGNKSLNEDVYCGRQSQ